jgi:hypothetical protein
MRLYIRVIILGKGVEAGKVVAMGIEASNPLQAN